MLTDTQRIEIATYVKLIMPTTFRSDDEISEVKKAIATYVDEVCNLGTDIHILCMDAEIL